jgi:D-3-phosphoglycerate dehydrogenase
MPAQPLVVISSRSFGSGEIDVVARLTGAGCQVERIGSDHQLDACRATLSRARAWIAGVAPVTAAHFDTAPQLAVLARYGVGYDAVDVREATRRGIVVTNTPGANAGAVAEHALGLTLAALRGIAAGDRAVREGRWEGRRGREVSALTVGIVGAGRIGMGYADRMRALGATVLGHDPFVAQAPGVEIVSLPELLARSDVISLHAPGGREIITAAALISSRPGLVLVNTARADLVDEAAVARALRTGQLAAYAADTLLGEATSSTSPLLDRDLTDRVVITPHTAAQTVQAIDAMGSMATDDVLAVLAGAAPIHPVEGS